MMNDKVVIFCQSPGDIQYVLSIYEKNHKTSQISIFCINVEGMYLFLQKLNLELSELVFIPYNVSDFKNPFKIISEKIRLKRLYQKYIKNKNGCEIYFFAIWYDWITFYLLGKAFNKNKVFYIKHFLGVNENCRNAKGIKEKLLLFIYNSLTNLKLKYVDCNKSILLFPYSTYNIQQGSFEISDIAVFDKYTYKLNVDAAKAILLLESDKSSYHLINNYNLTIVNVVKKLKSKGYYLLLKGHPRLGHSKVLDNYIDEFIPEYIPAEFVDIGLVKYIFGLDSFALAFYAKKYENIYSIIEDFDFVSDEARMDSKNYLIANSDSKMKFMSIIKNEML